MNSNFLEANNITSLITTVRNNVKQKINYDITSEPKYINVLKKLVKTIHKANINKPVSTEYMNNLVVTKCVPFLVNQIQKSNNEDRNTYDRGNVFGNLPLNTSERPAATRTRDTALEKKNRHPNLGNQSQTDFSNLVLGNKMSSFLNTNTNQNQGSPRMNLEPPPRQMSSLNNQAINIDRENMNFSNNTNSNTSINNNIQMDIANLPAPMSMGNEFDNGQLINPQNDRETQNFVNNLAGVNSKDVDESIDFAKRLEEMQREREYANTGTQKTEFENRNEQINDLSNLELNNRETHMNRSNDEFFQKLAENNSPDMNNTRERDNALSLMNSTNLNRNYMEMDGDMNIDESAYSAYENNRIQLGQQNVSQSRENIQQFENNIRDSSLSINGEENPGISEIVSRREAEVKKNYSKEYIEQTYIPTSYQFERRKREILCIDVSEHLTNMTVNGSNTKKVVENLSNTYWGRFRINLQDTLIIDKISDIYIESIIINNPAQANPFTNLYIVMDIEEFNIKTLSNNGNMMDKFVLPNENTETVGNSKIMKYHLKSNYVASINPTKLSSLTFNITNENGDSVDNTFDYIGEIVDGNYNVGYSGDVGVSDNVQLRLFDAIYNASYQFVGNIDTHDSVNKKLTFLKPIYVHLIDDEKLYYPSSRTSNFTTVEITYGVTTITVDSDPADDFSVGDNVYIGNGAILGKIESINSVHPETITFEKAITRYMPDGIALYTASPLPRVFASNDKSNRIILELVIMPR